MSMLSIHEALGLTPQSSPQKNDELRKDRSGVALSTLSDLVSCGLTVGRRLSSGGYIYRLGSFCRQTRWLSSASVGRNHL